MTGVLLATWTRSVTFDILTAEVVLLATHMSSPSQRKDERSSPVFGVRCVCARR